MIQLAVPSLLWAFSFGLIARHLKGADPTFVAAVRLALSAAVFLPFLRPTGRRVALALATVGAVQYGLMYLLYIRSYAHLAGHEVAVFTVLTPVHVLAVEALRARRIAARAAAGAALAVIGAAVVTWRGPRSEALVAGFLLVQGANLCFAAGQVAYRRLDAARALHHRGVYAWLYLGATVPAAAALAFGDPLAAARTVDAAGWVVLVYLGLVASGLGFFLWNVGATRVGVGTLAVFNNVKVPLAVLVAVTVFGESADPVRLAGGGALVAAGLVLARRG